MRTISVTFLPRSQVRVLKLDSAKQTKAFKYYLCTACMLNASENMKILMRVSQITIQNADTGSDCELRFYFKHQRYFKQHYQQTTIQPRTSQVIYTIQNNKMLILQTTYIISTCTQKLSLFFFLFFYRLDSYSRILVHDCETAKQ